ncbi:neuropeptides B/W receptor type 2-like [Diadema setosum]|uniref:neuropeptides B/W receptor type 2-like n=1 Tax=Diadema setosum TaxID=31175 RepID=UPI003B3B86FF
MSSGLMLDTTAAMYVAFGVFGIIDNGIVLIVIARTKALRDATNLLIANQSLIDLLASAFLLFLQVVPASIPSGKPRAADFVCEFWMSWYPFWALITASGGNLIVITIERFYAVTCPILYRQFISYKRVTLLALMPWVYGLVFNAHFFAWARVDGQICHLFEMPNIIIWKTIGIVTFILNFLGPSCTMAILYAIIAAKLRHQLRQHTTGINHREKARRNVIKTLFIVCACYILCWAPNDVYSLFCYIGGTLQFEGVIYDITVFMAFANMWINPIIYSFRYDKFRKGLRKLLCGRSSRRPSMVISSIY